MTTPAPSVHWIRFGDPLGGWLQLDAEERWQPQLNIDVQEEPGDIGLDAMVYAKPAAVVTVDLVLPNSDVDFAAEAAIQRVHQLLARRQYCDIEAALTPSGLPYNRVDLPRVRITDFAVSRIVTADGKPGLRFFEGEAHEVAPGRWCKLTRTGAA